MNKKTEMVKKEIADFYHKMWLDEVKKTKTYLDGARQTNKLVDAIMANVAVKYGEKMPNNVFQLSFPAKDMMKILDVKSVKTTRDHIPVIGGKEDEEEIYYTITVSDFGEDDESECEE